MTPVARVADDALRAALLAAERETELVQERERYASLQAHYQRDVEALCGDLRRAHEREDLLRAERDAARRELAQREELGHVPLARESWPEGLELTPEEAAL